MLRVGKDGKPFTLFETKDLSVQVVRLGPDGALYAATVPSGKVYKLKPDATASRTIQARRWYSTRLHSLKHGGRQTATSRTQKHPSGKPDDAKTDAKSHYIWDLTFDSAGRLYIATGGPGAVYRVDTAKAGAKPEEFFKSDEQHIRAWRGTRRAI